MNHDKHQKHAEARLPTLKAIPEENIMFTVLFLISKEIAWNYPWQRQPKLFNYQIVYTYRACELAR